MPLRLDAAHLDHSKGIIKASSSPPRLSLTLLFSRRPLISSPFFTLCISVRITPSNRSQTRTLPLGEDHSPTHKHTKSNKSNRSCLWQLALSLTTLCSSVHLLDMIDLNYFYWEKLNFTLSSHNKWSKGIAACQWQLSTHTNPLTLICGTMLCPSHFFVHTKCV